MQARHLVRGFVKHGELTRIVIKVHPDDTTVNE